MKWLKILRYCPVCRKIGWTKVSLSRKYGIPKPIIEKLISVLPEEKA